MKISNNKIEYLRSYLENDKNITYINKIRSPIVKAGEFALTFTLNNRMYFLQYLTDDIINQNKDCLFDRLSIVEDMLRAHYTEKKDMRSYGYVYSVYNTIDNKWVDSGNKIFFSLSELKSIFKQNNDIELLYNVDKGMDIYNKYKNNKDICKLIEEEFITIYDVGHCVKLCLLHNPVDYYAYEKLYFEYAENNKNLFIRNRGLTRIEYYELVLKFLKRCKEINNKCGITFEEAYQLLLYHILTKVFTGYSAEQKASFYLKNNGFIVDKTDKEMDSKYGVDLIIYNNMKEKKYKYFIQIKPLSHFNSIDKKEKLSSYRSLCKEKFNMDIYYMVYERDENGLFHFVMKENNNLFLNFEDLDNKKILYSNNKKILA